MHRGAGGGGQGWGVWVPAALPASRRPRPAPLNHAASTRVPPCRPQVLNDLLDPSRTNLKLREDTRRGQAVHVEGIREENLVSAEHARAVIAAGNEARKTSATAFNEGSSRSHTIIRITIEASGGWAGGGVAPPGSSRASARQSRARAFARGGAPPRCTLGSCQGASVRRARVTRCLHRRPSTRRRPR